MTRIRELRKQKGVSVEKLAEVLDISIPYLYDIEKGRRRLHEDLIEKLCSFFNVSSDYLLGRSDNGSSTPWYERDEPPTEADLEEIIENTPTLRLYGEKLDDDIKDDLKLAFRVVWEQQQKKKEAIPKQK